MTASRPFSWINTCLPFLAAAIAAGHPATWPVVLGAVYFLAPFNLLMYGVNDLFDYESDRRNPRKGGIEGALLPPARGLVLWSAIAVTNAPLLVAIVVLAGGARGAIVLLTAFTALAYSVPPLRTKVIPGLDSITSALHFTLPAVCGAVLAGATAAELPWRVLVAFFVWGIASQALGAIQDVEYDRAAGQRSIATWMGARGTAVLSTAGYTLAVLLVLGLGGAAVIAAVALLPYVALSASCLSGDAGQARRAWKGFLGMNLLSGFVITQVLLHAWGLGPRDVLTIVAWGAGAGAWACLGLYLVNRLAARRQALRQVAPRSLSVVVPARDEEDRIGDALRAILAQRYPGQLELICVDDDSRDGTAAEARELLRPGDTLISAPSLPSGWSGKPWACHLGTRAAHGELIAFVDADTELAPEALAVGAAELEGQGGGMVSLLTRYRMDSWIERALIPGFAVFQHCFAPAAILELTHGRLAAAAYGYGPCMVVDADAYRRAGGHRAIKATERAEDFDLARLMAQTGAPVRVVHGADLGATRHYRSWSEIASGWRRSYYACSGHSLPLSLLGTLGVAAVMLLPLALAAAAAAVGDGPSLVGALWGCAGLLILRASLARYERQPWTSILWHPITFVATLWCQTLSIAFGLAGRRTVWRGRPMAEGVVS